MKRLGIGGKGVRTGLAEVERRKNVEPDVGGAGSGDVRPRVGAGDTFFTGQEVFVVVFVEEHGEVPLFQFVEAIGLLGARFGFAERGEKECGENRDGGDDDQEFDEGKTAFDCGLPIADCGLNGRES